MYLLETFTPQEKTNPPSEERVPKAKRSITENLPQTKREAEKQAKAEILLGHYRDSMKMLTMTPEEIVSFMEENANEEEYVN